ncbi:MAG: hypothetical protein JEZ06_10100 [Anaerolineaceae bacterium]|nr:hypothetical protein [Anaerolineaceae bacterium]
MQQREFWVKWAQILQQWKVKDFAADALEAIGPLSIMLAQIVYFGQPFFRKSMSAQQWSAFGGLLEDREICIEFVAYLRQEEFE